MTRFFRRIVWLGFMACASASFLPAQSNNPPQTDSSKPSVPPQPSSPPDNDSTALPSDPSLAEPDKRMFGMIPDFENTNDIPANHRPLTVREKYILSLHQSFDFSAHLGNAFQAAMQQAANGQPHYGQGWGAYGERFAAAEGDQVTASVLIYGVLPSILHEDPRYFRQGKGRMMARVWYAMNRTFVTRRDDGTSGFNNSEIFGQLVSCGISTSYYPPQDRTVGRVFSNWAVNLAGNSAYNVLSEYYPDLKRGLFHRRQRPTVQSGN
jgi:hypothetical protein